MVMYSLSEGRLEEGNREKGFEVGFWGLVFSDNRAGRKRPLGFRDPLRARIESRAVFFCAGRLIASPGVQGPVGSRHSNLNHLRFGADPVAGDDFDIV